MYPNPRGHQAGCKRHPDIQTHLVPEFSHNGMGSHTHCHTSGQRHIGNTWHGGVHSCEDLASAKSSQTQITWGNPFLPATCVGMCTDRERERESDSMCGRGVCMQSEYKHRERAGIAMECMYSEARGNACISERDDILVYN